MKQLIIILITVTLMDPTNSQYPDCVSCADGSIPLTPLSYTIRSSDVFNGTQPSNDSAILTDCDQGFDGGDNSDLSNTFVWSRTNSETQQVSIVLRFDQQISIDRIGMFFWNSPSNSATVPTVRMEWADHTMQFTDIDITTNSSNKTEDGQSILNITINDKRFKYLYLRIEMIFYGNSEWIFLGEVQFCGNTAPYHITQPSTDNDVQIVSPTATMATLTCSLNVTIPSTVIIRWTYDNGNLMAGNITGNTARIQIQNPTAGVYQCVFNDILGGWTIRRNIRLVIAGPPVITHHPTSRSDVPVGRNITLTCGASGLGTVVYSWERSSGSNWTSVSNDNTTSYTTDATLTIGQYMYRCRVSNEAGSVVSNITTVNVYDIVISTAAITDAIISSSANTTVEHSNYYHITTTTTSATYTTTASAITNTSANTTSIFASIIRTTTITTSTMRPSINTSTDNASVTPTTSTTRAIASTSFTATTLTTSVTPTATSSSIASNITRTTTTATRDTNTNATSTITPTNSTSTTIGSQSASSDDNNDFSIAVIAAIVFVIVFIIIITLVWVGIIVVWKGMKSQQQTEEESIYYSTIDEKMKKASAVEPNPVYDDINNKEPHYISISVNARSSKQANKVTMQDNPAYSATFEHLQDNPAYHISSA